MKVLAHHDELVRKVSQGCEMVWDSIAYDWMDMAGDSISAEEWVEACTDANRLKMFASDEHEEAKDELVKELGSYRMFVEMVASAQPYKRFGC